MPEKTKYQKDYRQKLGRETEALAARYLEGRGFEIIRRNFRIRHGEIDLICRDGDWLVFVEVKSSRTGAAWLPEERIDRRKRRRLALAATAFMAEYNTAYEGVRFDVALVTQHRRGEWKVEHIANAFQLDEDDRDN